MDVFYTKSLKFLLDKSSIRHSKLRKACKEILKFLKNEPSIQIHLQTNPDRFVKPFLIALRTGKNALVLKGLFQIQKMIEFQFFKKQKFYDTLVTSVCQVFDPIQDDPIRISLLKVLLPMVMHLEIHGKILRDVIKTCFNIYLVSNDVIVQKTAKASLMQILNIIFKKIEIPMGRNIYLPPQSRGKNMITDQQIVSLFVKRVLQNVIRRHGKFYSESHKDGVVIFNALCRISMKKINPKNAVELKNRILSLELIHSVLRHSGPVFRSSHPFIEDIKRILCISLLQNSVSSIPEVFQQALLIFKTLILYFNKPLKSEIALFFTNCFLPILESNYSSFQHKSLVLDVLKDIFSRSQIIFDLFINYDCWEEEGSQKKNRIVERTIKRISQTIELAPGQIKQNVLTSEQGRDLQQKAIFILSKILRRLKSFIKDDQSESQSPTKKNKNNKSSSSDVSSSSSLSSSSNNQKKKNKNDQKKKIIKRRGSGQHHKQIENIVRKKSEKLDFNEGVKLFNIKPSKGVNYLVKIGRVKDDPLEIAKFLMRNDLDIDQSQVGAYLANKDNEVVLHKFTQLVGLKDLTYLGAFRKYLTSFRIPGEGQQIDRILQKFAQVFMEENPGYSVFKNADSAYFFAYASMWLHTDLHNPALKFHARMTIDDFRSVTAGKNEGENYDEEFLVSVFNDIKETEIIIHGDNNTSSSSKQQSTESLKKKKNEMYKQRGKKRDLFHKETVKIFHKTRREFGVEWKKKNTNISGNKKKKNIPLKRKRSSINSSGKLERSGSIGKKNINKSIPQKKKKQLPQTPPQQQNKKGSSSPKMKKINLPQPPKQKLPTRKKMVSKQQQQQQDVQFFYISTETEKVMIINALFKVLWKHVTNAVEDLLRRTARNEDVIYLSLDSLQSGLYVSSRLGIDAALNKFAEVLVSQTGLFNPSPKYHLNVKNIESIRLVMKVVQKEYNHLTTGWIHFLSAISKLDRIRMLGKKGGTPIKNKNNNDSHHHHHQTPKSPKRSKRISFFKKNSGIASGGIGSNSSSNTPKHQSIGGTTTTTTTTTTNADVFSHLNQFDFSTETSQSVLRNHGILFKPGSQSSSSSSSSQSSKNRNNNNNNSNSAMIRNKKKQLRVQQRMLDESSLEYVFLNSIRLSDTSIICFVSALCKLSSTELHVLKEPRDFCLKKLIDVSVYNIPTRSQAVWTSLWDVLSSHFISVSSHPNPNIAMLSIDALKQVAYHFFQKEEMKSFMFQSKFLLPFNEMMDRTHSDKLDDKIRLMIVDIIGNLIKSRANNIKSGWSTMFQILRSASRDKNKTVLRSAFRYTKEMLEEETFSRIIGSNLEVGEDLKEEQEEQEEEENEGEEEEEEEEENDNDNDNNKKKKKKKKKKRLKNHIQFFLSYVDTIVSFGENTTDHEIGQRAIKLIERCSRKVSSQKIPGLERRDGKFRSDKTSHLETWLKILFSLSTLTHDKHPMEIRIIALETVFKVLKENGEYFEEKLWEIIFKGSLRLLFDDIKQVEETGGVESDWMKNTCHKSLVLLIDTFVLFYDSISFLFDEILNLIKMITRRESERLCYIGSNCLEKLIFEGGENYSDIEWSKISSLLKLLAKRMQVREKKIKKEEEEEKDDSDDEKNIGVLIENQKLLFDVLEKLHKKFFNELDWEKHTKVLLSIFEEEKTSILTNGYRTSNLLEIRFLCMEYKLDILFTSLFIKKSNKKTKELKKKKQEEEEEEKLSVDISTSEDDNQKPIEVKIELNEKEEEEEDNHKEIEKYFEEELTCILELFISKSKEFIEGGGSNNSQLQVLLEEEEKVVNKYEKRIFLKIIEESERYEYYFDKCHQLFCECFVSPCFETRRILIDLFKKLGPRK